MMILTNFSDLKPIDIPQHDGPPVMIVLSMASIPISEPLEYTEEQSVTNQTFLLRVLLSGLMLGLYFPV
jgi:hypothetical protein